MSSGGTGGGGIIIIIHNASLVRSISKPDLADLIAKASGANAATLAALQAIYDSTPDS